MINDVRGVLIQARALDATKTAFLSPAKGLKARYASTSDVNQVFFRKKSGTSAKKSQGRYEIAAKSICTVTLVVIE